MKTRTGASMKPNRSTWAGMMSSLSRSLTESQGVWNQPPVHIEKRAQALGPVSIGPMRRWIRPQIFRSNQIMNIAFKAMKARTIPRLTSIGAQ